MGRHENSAVWRNQPVPPRPPAVSPVWSRNFLRGMTPLKNRAWHQHPMPKKFSQNFYLGAVRHVLLIEMQ